MAFPPRIRDTATFFLQEAKCKDVRIEPALLPVRPTSFSRKTNTQEEARLDVAAVGLYAPFERTFFDIRVTNGIVAHANVSTLFTIKGVVDTICMSASTFRGHSLDLPSIA